MPRVSLENMIRTASDHAGEAARVAVYETLSKRFGAGRRPSRSKAVPAPALRGSKRTRAELQRTADACLGVIRTSGEAIPEQIARALQLRASDITLPLKILLRDQLVTARGRKRFTFYKIAE